MAYYFAEGTSIQFSSTFGTAKTITAITNANPAVATSTAHGFVTGDEILFTGGGWEDLNNSVLKVTVIDANSFSIQGFNATNTSFFPSGGGANTSAQKVSGFASMPQVLNISTSGGDARFVTISPLASRNDINVPTGFNAVSMQITMAHDPANATYQSLVALGRTLSPVAFRLALSGGATAYGYGYVSVSEAPTISRGQVNQVNAAATIQGRLISYS